jgi:hypothetical protein
MKETLIDDRRDRGDDEHETRDVTAGNRVALLRSSRKKATAPSLAAAGSLPPHATSPSRIDHVSARASRWPRMLGDFSRFYRLERLRAREREVTTI